MFKNFAFTLSELLIIIGIISIIATLTIPNLVTKINNEITVIRLKQSYTELKQVIKLSEIENGDVSSWDFSLPARTFANKYLVGYVKISNSETARDVNSRLQYKRPNGKSASSAIYNGQSSAVITLSNGALLTVDSWYPSTKDYRAITIDINGYSKPNVVGKDLFWFIISSGENGPVSTHSSSNTYKENVLECQTTGEQCSTVIIKDNWKIKYKN
jgi:type II secretory pathway pseudopilin PulG